MEIAALFEKISQVTKQKLTTLIPTNITTPLTTIVQQDNRAIQTMTSTMNALMSIT